MEAMPVGETINLAEAINETGVIAFQLAVNILIFIMFATLFLRDHVKLVPLVEEMLTLLTSVKKDHQETQLETNRLIRESNESSKTLSTTIRMDLESFK